MAGGILVVAAEDAAGAPLPTPSSEAADARIAIPMTATAKPAASPAPTRPFTGPCRARRGPSIPPRGMVGLAPCQNVVAPSSPNRCEESPSGPVPCTLPAWLRCGAALRRDRISGTRCPRAVGPHREPPSRPAAVCFIPWFWCPWRLCRWVSRVVGHPARRNRMSKGGTALSSPPRLPIARPSPRARRHAPIGPEAATSGRRHRTFTPRGVRPQRQPRSPAIRNGVIWARASVRGLKNRCRRNSDPRFGRTTPG